MTLFLFAAALLLVLVLYAVLRPLLGRSPRVAAAVAAIVVAGSTALYLQYGTPDALDPTMVRAPETLAEARAQLERKLADSPEDAEGWRLLGRAYTAEEKPADAARAYAEAAKRAPRDADILTEAAEARALANAGHRFDEAAVAQLKQALAVDPKHQRARWFLGISQRQAGQPAQAAETWAPLLATVDPKTVEVLLTQVNEARAEAGLAPITAPKHEAAAGALPVRVSLSPVLLERLEASPQARVFVIARAAGGPPVPVAVQKHPVDALPLDITLSDADSLMPTAKLSALKEAEISARLSLAGSADRQPGDLESATVKVSLPAKGPVTLVIGGE